MSSPPDETQLEDLVRRFSRLVRSVASRVGGQAGRQIADDVEQHVFLSLWKQLRREQIIDNPGSYIYRCAVRETVRLLAASRAATGVPLEPDEPEPPSPDRTPAEQLAARERTQAVADALKTLSLDRRRATQAHLSGFSVAETMAMYGWSYQRARNLSARGIADLRAALRERDIDG